MNTRIAGNATTYGTCNAGCQHGTGMTNRYTEQCRLGNTQGSREGGLISDLLLLLFLTEKCDSQCSAALAINCASQQGQDDIVADGADAGNTDRDNAPMGAYNNHGLDQEAHEKTGSD